MAAVTTPTLHMGHGHGTAVVDQDKSAPSDVPLPQVHTPPTTDEGSHKDDDAASSSSLSELGDDILDEENRMRFEDAARAGAEAEQHTEIKPDRYENNIPIFQPTMEEFRDFEKYVKGVDPYGMQSGIVLIDPPEEWKRARKALDEMIKSIKIKNPITQEFHGSQGIYTQRNMEKMRSYNLPQWRAVCEQTENQPPARRGEKRLNADKLIGRGSIKNKKSEASPVPDSARRKAGRPKNTPIKEEPNDNDSNLLAPPTPTSPNVTPTVPSLEEEDEKENTPDPNPTRAKRGRKSAGKPKGRQPRTTKKDTSKGAETSVASRRLRNQGAAVDEVDEEAFKDFDYRIYDNDQWTAERCEELEDKYWKSLNFSNPMYGADMAGSLFDDQTKEWNVAKLPNLLDLLGQPIPGVNTAYLYLGMWRATFAWHLEDVDLYSINYIHFGAPKQWYSISQKDAHKFENAMKSIWPQDAKDCDQFLRHKTYLISPAILKSKFGVTVNKIVHREGQFVITFPIGYHSGYNLGYNCAESVNFAIPNWLNYGKTARKCQCEADSVFIDVDWFVRRMNGEPTPEYEEVEVTDDDEDDEPVDLPTPPGSDRGKVKVPQKRKRPAKDVGPNKKAKKLIKIRKISRNQPCCLCPNDFAWEELLPTTHGQQAHRTCAMYTPETYIATLEGKEMVVNVENISKARLELKCYECRQKKGSCFQCSSAKCTKSYHATCAMQAGVQVDRGEIGIWHEGVEYRDIGFDWRCRLHRSVKRTRITSELSTSNHSNSCWDNAEFRQYLSSLKAGDTIQYQSTHADDIEAGLVVAGYDGGQGAVLVKVLPDVQTVKEVEPAWILFVDSATSCLQPPSASARDLPEELQGKTASMPDSSERKPSEGDTFTEHPKTEWSEFVSAAPPANKLQKKVHLARPKQLWLYLGGPSTESKAHYTADPNILVHDRDSVFLDTVEPPKPVRSVMAPPSHPRKQSLAATFPIINVATQNTINKMRQQATASSPLGATPIHLGPKQDAVVNNARDAQRKGAQYRDMVTGAEAKANEQARILQRQQAKAQQLDMQDSAPQSGMTGIGIDLDAIERQRLFQQRSMNPWPQHTSPLHSPYPSPYSNGIRPQQLQFSTDWMQPTSPHLNQNQSPSAFAQFPSYMQQSHTQYSYSNPPQHHRSASLGSQVDLDRLRLETARIESIRAAASQPPPPPPSAAVERQRRISNPAYPFKSPDQIKARREAEKNSPPGSRPGSSYQTPNAGTPQEVFRPSSSSSIHGPDLQHPPQFINPNVTQISPPGSSAGRRSASNSISASHGPMGPPMQPQMQRPLSRGMSDSLGFSNSMMSPVSGYVPRRSIYDPLYKPNQNPQPLPQPITQPNSVPLPPPAPMAEPSPLLLAGLQPRPVSPNGYPVNDKVTPQGLSDWQSQGKFWGKVANYYVKKHEMSAGVYRSPFAPKLEGQPGALADAYYNGLSLDDRVKVDDVRQNGMRL